MSGIEKVLQFLDEAKTYYLATTDGDQPRVRPFGTALVHDGTLYIQTGKVKEVSKQLAKNPKAEICAFHGGKWLRLSGELVDDDDRADEIYFTQFDNTSSLSTLHFTLDRYSDKTVYVLGD